MTRPTHGVRVNDGTGVGAIRRDLVRYVCACTFFFLLFNSLRAAPPGQRRVGLASSGRVASWVEICNTGCTVAHSSDGCLIGTGLRLGAVASGAG